MTLQVCIRAMRTASRAVLGLVLFGNVISIAAASIVGTKAVRLSSVDKAEVERVACITPHGLRVERLYASSLNLNVPKPLPIDVTVYCQSHVTTQQGSPIRYVVACGNSVGAWQCEAQRLG
jgi:hypothetical protein